MADDVSILFEKLLAEYHRAKNPAKIVCQMRFWEKAGDQCMMDGDEVTASLYYFLKDSQAVRCPKPLYDAWVALYLYEDAHCSPDRAATACNTPNECYDDDEWLLLLRHSDRLIEPVPNGYRMNILANANIQLNPHNQDSLGGIHGYNDDDPMANGSVCYFSNRRQRYTAVNRLDQAVKVYAQVPWHLPHGDWCLDGQMIG